MALRTAKQLLRKDVKLRIANLGEDEKLRQSKVVTDKAGGFSSAVSVHILNFNIIISVSLKHDGPTGRTTGQA